MRAKPPTILFAWFLTKNYCQHYEGLGTGVEGLRELYMKQKVIGDVRTFLFAPSFVFHTESEFCPKADHSCHHNTSLQ